MLLIDSGAEGHLIKTLESIRMNPGLLRCIHVMLAGTEFAHPDLRPLFLEIIQESLLCDNKKVYCCEDGDIYVIASGISPREFITLKTLAEMQIHMQKPEQFLRLYELSMSTNHLLVQLEKKSLLRRAVEEDARRKSAQQRIEQERNSILQRSVDEATARNIQNMRDHRAALEIMIVEDDPFSCRLVESVLKKDFSLTIVQEGKYLIQQYTQKAPDILFMDINLPDVNGHDLVSKIMSFDPHAYIVMLSGNSDKENVMQAVQRGAKGFIGKPFNREKLYQYIERCPSFQGQVSQ